MILHVYAALKRMEKRPAMWTGQNNLKSIAIYVQGYRDALRDNQISYEDSIDPFSDWTANKLGYPESTAGWPDMILAHTLGYDPETIDWQELATRPVTEEEHLQSIKKFYSLLEEFKQESKSQYSDNQSRSDSH